MVSGGKAFALTRYRSVIDKVRSNASLISMLAQFEHIPSLHLRHIAGTVFTNIFIEKHEFNEDAVVSFYAQNPSILETLNRDIEKIDLGIRSVRIEKGPKGPIAQFEHNGLSSSLPMQLESHGTRQIIKVFPLLVQALTTGGIAVVDELDLMVHPQLSAAAFKDDVECSRTFAQRGPLIVCLGAPFGGQVDERTISSGRTQRFCTLGSFANLRRRSSAAVAPISWSGWRMVVSGGYAMLANSISSKPMTEMSSGTLWPASRNAVMALRAETSL
jgi:hypothetical protein